MRLSCILLCLGVFLMTRCGFDLVELEYDSKTFDGLAGKILAHPEIFQMDDFTRHNKFLNGIPIKLSEGASDSSSQVLSKAVISMGLDSRIVEDLRSELERSKLRDFFRSGDTILFTVDGMLDTSWGFLYSTDNLKMDSAWFMFHGNSLLYTEDINANWKKVAIK